jgi:hypothetical protein
MPARSATVEDKVTVVEKMPTKGGAPSPLRLQSPVDESRAAFAAREGLTKDIVAGSQSCIMNHLVVDSAGVTP